MPLPTSHRPSSCCPSSWGQEERWREEWWREERRREERRREEEQYPMRKRDLQGPTSNTFGNIVYIVFQYVLCCKSSGNGRDGFSLLHSGFRVHSHKLPPFGPTEGQKRFDQISSQ